MGDGSESAFIIMFHETIQVKQHHVCLFGFTLVPGCSGCRAKAVPSHLLATHPSFSSPPTALADEPPHNITNPLARELLKPSLSELPYHRIGFLRRAHLFIAPYQRVVSCCERVQVPGRRGRQAIIHKHNKHVVCSLSIASTTTTTPPTRREAHRQ